EPTMASHSGPVTFSCVKVIWMSWRLTPRSVSKCRRLTLAPTKTRPRPSVAAFAEHRSGGPRRRDRHTAFEAERRAAAGRAHREVRDVLADRRPDERNQRAVVAHGGGDEVVRVQRGRRVGAGGAAEEQGILAVGENEELGDLVPETLRVERGDGEDESHETPQVAPHRPSGPGWENFVGSKRCHAQRGVNPARR